MPSLPANIGIDVDYSRLKRAELQFSDDTVLKYIPLGYLGRLFSHLQGDDLKIVPSGALRKNNVVDSVLLARNFIVRFESEEAFDANFEAKLEAIKSLPGISGKVSYEKESSTTIVAHVESDQQYLVALHARDWDDCDLN